MLGHTFNPNTLGAEADRSEFQVSLVFTVRFRIARTIKKPLSQKTKNHPKMNLLVLEAGRGAQ